MVDCLVDVVLHLEPMLFTFIMWSLFFLKFKLIEMSLVQNEFSSSCKKQQGLYFEKQHNQNSDSGHFASGAPLSAVERWGELLTATPVSGASYLSG